MDVHYTEHAQDVVTERGLSPQWIAHALSNPELTEEPGDGTVHYLARIAERANRVLRVVVNPESRPARVVTAFFDRRMKGKLP